MFKAAERSYIIMTIDKGYTDTPITGVTKLDFKRGLVNFKENFRVSSDTPQEVILTNLSSPLDRSEKFRIGYDTVKDVYRNTDIHQSVQAPSSRGISVLCQLTNTISSVDATNPEYRVDLPISAHLVLKFPASAEISAEMIEEHIGRLISGLYATGSTSVDRLKSLMRGALVPSDI